MRSPRTTLAASGLRHRWKMSVALRLRGRVPLAIVLCAFAEVDGQEPEAAAQDDALELSVYLTKLAVHNQPRLSLIRGAAASRECPAPRAHDTALQSECLKPELPSFSTTHLVPY